MAGCLAGLITSAILWVFPIPVALIVWLFGLKGLFADYMYMAIPFFISLPLLGALIGWFTDRRDGTPA